MRSLNRMLTAGECAQLRTGRCTLSHWPSPTRLPVCTDFCERGTCAATAASASASDSAGVSVTCGRSLPAAPRTLPARRTLVPAIRALRLLPARRFGPPPFFYLSLLFLLFYVFLCS